MKKTGLNELKMYMNGVTNVQEWNERREKAKAFFESETISQLDASCYIKELLND